MKHIKFAGILGYEQIPVGEPGIVIINKKKKKKERERTSRIEDFAVSADHRVKIKENENRDTYLDLARELKSYRT